MPEISPLGIATAASQTGLQLLGGVLDRRATKKNNKEQRDYNTEMYNIQRKDALSDYATNNEYNSPRATMQRYRDAGLNENLIYGNTSTAAPVRSTDSKSFNPTAPKFETDGIANSLGNYANTAAKSAETDNLQATNNILVQELLLKKAQTQNTEAQTLNTNSNTAGSTFDLALKNSLRPNNLQMAEAQLNKTNTEIDATKLGMEKTATDITYTKNQDLRSASANASSLREAVERILHSQAQRSKTSYEKRQIEAAIQSLQSDNKIKQLDIELKKQNVQPHDALWQRTLKLKVNELLNSDHHQQVKKNLTKLGDGVKNWINSKPAPKRQYGK